MLFFRFPFGENIMTVDENPDRNFVSFVSFDQSETLNFKGNLNVISKEEFLNNQHFTSEIPNILKEFNTENQENYLEKLEKVIDFIKENQLSKLVYSRIKLLDYQDLNESENINLSQSFLKLCENYPNAFAYLFIENGICWMGAFSEILGKFNKETNEFETMSLAGTLPINEDWTSKEIEEQKPVSDYIFNILSEYSDNVHQSETYDHISGNIKHLRTNFKAKINPEELEKLISVLHPTPAVCGIPKDFCKKAIERFEQHPRSFYAGYIKVETAKEILYFVNLRCAEFLKNVALIHVGGGITSQSNPEKEWRETELKSQAILNSLVF
ncbi:chorismate-binding protein [uncultured Chryseobacterium sp.]|uniref:chorismate-binding protein n=1 Tax=uncultured Chryseobacterium sp. TaxID=259322 RepID=UPI0026140D80|nr:chorismate-binding protein [uncultured Chryseobacterium sp.]